MGWRASLKASSRIWRNRSALGVGFDMTDPDIVLRLEDCARDAASEIRRLRATYYRMKMTETKLRAKVEEDEARIAELTELLYVAARRIVRATFNSSN
jgi:hypothetical protein